MKQYALLRTLLACFLLYIAWPSIQNQSTNLASIFWVAWLGFFLLVIGSNLAVLLQMTKPLSLEQEQKKEYSAGKN